MPARWTKARKEMPRMHDNGQRFRLATWIALCAPSLMPLEVLVALGAAAGMAASLPRRGAPAREAPARGKLPPVPGGDRPCLARAGL